MEMTFVHKCLGGNRGGQRRPQGGSKASSSQGGGSRSPSTSTGSRLRPSGAELKTGSDSTF